jgi:hypothetical protein
MAAIFTRTLASALHATPSTRISQFKCYRPTTDADMGGVYKRSRYAALATRLWLVIIGTGAR